MLYGVRQFYALCGKVGGGTGVTLWTLLPTYMFGLDVTDRQTYLLVLFSVLLNTHVIATQYKPLLPKHYLHVQNLRV